ncbi:tetratricopeptide repeat protein [Flavobacterium sp. ZB4R12]|uniref:tetratricopeptide repeat protein n=1 Tax=Flavobacterium sp. ZB4R12 TaxID=3398732 RepID=UPI003AAE4FC6
MKTYIFLYITIMSIFSFKGHAQNSKFYVTDKISDKYAYVDVIKTYERVAEKGYKSVDLFKKLGDSYYSNSDLNKAAQWYCELFAMNTNDLEPVYYYQYAKSLNFIGQNDEANRILEKLKQKSEVVVEKKNRKQR